MMGVRNALLIGIVAEKNLMDKKKMVFLLLSNGQKNILLKRGRASS